MQRPPCVWRHGELLRVVAGPQSGVPYGRAFSDDITGSCVAITIRANRVCSLPPLHFWGGLAPGRSVWFGCRAGETCIELWGSTLRPPACASPRTVRFDPSHVRFPCVSPFPITQQGAHLMRDSGPPLVAAFWRIPAKSIWSFMSTCLLDLRFVSHQADINLPIQSGFHCHHTAFLSGHSGKRGSARFASERCFAPDLCRPPITWFSARGNVSFASSLVLTMCTAFLRTRSGIDADIAWGVCDQTRGASDSASRWRFGNLFWCAQWISTRRFPRWVR